MFSFICYKQLLVCFLSYTGQLWNIPIQVSAFEGSFREGVEPENRYVINVTHPASENPRAFTGLLYDITWEFEKGPCFYVGNQQGGPIYEVEDPNDSVIEGTYENYRVGGAFETEYFFSQFDSNRCIV